MKKCMVNRGEMTRYPFYIGVAWMILWNPYAKAQTKVEDTQVRLSTGVEVALTNRLDLELEYQLRLADEAQSVGAHYTSLEVAYGLTKKLKLVAELRYKTNPEETSLRYAIGISGRMKMGKTRFSLTPEFLYETFPDLTETEAQKNVRAELEAKWTSGDAALYVNIEPMLSIDTGLAKERLQVETGFDYQLTPYLSAETYYLAQWRYKTKGTRLTHAYGFGLAFHL